MKNVKNTQIGRIKRKNFAKSFVYLKFIFIFASTNNTKTMKTVEKQIFEVGDVVVLKSGSPSMTVVEHCEECGIVTTMWFPTKETLPCIAEFVVDTLKLSK